MKKGKAWNKFGALLMLAFVSVIPLGFIWAVVPELRPLRAITIAATWFDPSFLGYNVIMVVEAILVPPLLAISYTLFMGEEKTRRMRRDLGALWAPNEGWISEYIEKQFRWQDYVIGVASMSVVVGLGGIILFILKPISTTVPWASMPGPGLDFRGGANLVMLGPFVEDKDAGHQFHMLIHSLTAYGFGFLGAYSYSVGQLIRGYFTVDLSPAAFVHASRRILSASVMALVISFGLSAITNETTDHVLLPILSFFFGYFPDRALRTIKQTANRALGSTGERPYGSTTLKKVSGMNLHHADRLEREGIDNVENLAASEPIEIALRTGFPYSQVKTWVGEARLRVHLGRHFVPFVERTGIRTYDQLWTFAQGWDAATRGPVCDFLVGAMGADGERKKRIAAKLEAIIALRDIIDGANDTIEKAPAPPAAPPALQIRRTSATSIQAS